jgi:hypothetical protein
MWLGPRLFYTSSHAFPVNIKHQLPLGDKEELMAFYEQWRNSQDPDHVCKVSADQYCGEGELFSKRKKGRCPMTVNYLQVGIR